jgi:NarL family two-component system response regulator LiaR
MKSNEDRKKAGAMNKIKILVVDDHPLMRDALLLALEDDPALQVIGQADNGIEALKLAAKLKPDVILMDLLMPGMGGLDAIAKLKEANPIIKVLVVTSLEDEEKVLAAIQAGALGYFPKSAPREYLFEAIHKVADGVPYLPAGIALKLFSSVREMKVFPSDSNADGREALTARQMEILALIGEGQTDNEIAESLHLTANTVRSHVHQIIQRLGVKNRTQAVIYARQHLNTD